MPKSLKPPLSKKILENSRSELDWKIGQKDSTIIVFSNKLNVKINRYEIIENNGNSLYDTIGIEEPKTNSVVVISNIKGKIGLIYEWRPIPQKWFWACVRGFGNENDESNLAAAKREAIEEIGNFSIIEENFLGPQYQNTTFFENPIGVVHLEVKELEEKLNENEGIAKFRFFSKNEILEMISNGKISDQFTISAIFKYLADTKQIIISS